MTLQVTRWSLFMQVTVCIKVLHGDLMNSAFPFPYPTGTRYLASMVVTIYKSHLEYA